jgi:hypothetical protein
MSFLPITGVIVTDPSKLGHLSNGDITTATSRRSIIGIRMCSRWLIPLVFALLTVASAQSTTSTYTFPTVHVEGTIGAVDGFFPHGFVPPVKITFKEENTHQIVTVDSKASGFYQAELSVGTYTMTAEHRGLATYVRVFRVKTPTKTVYLDGFVSPSYSCDAVIGGEELKDACGGMDSYPLPSRDGVRLRLDIRYAGRKRNADGSVEYFGSRTYPVLVAYDLFTLRADRVAYEERNRTLNASGNVVIEGQSDRGHEDRASFKIEDETAVRIP